jgi:hypothetical protein
MFLFFFYNFYVSGHISTWKRKTMGKSSKEKRKSEGGEEENEGGDSKEAYQEKVKYLSSISQPLAPRKLTKRLYKAVKKGDN